MPSNSKKLLAVGAVAAVGVGGAVLYYKYHQKKQGHADDDEISFTKKHTTTTTTRGASAARSTTTTYSSSTTASPTRTAAAATTAVSSPKTTTTTTTTTTAGSTTSSIGSAPPTVTHSLRQQQPQYVDFDKYHCRVRPAAGWEAVTEPSPVPTSGVIMLRRLEDVEKMQNMQAAVPHGAIPMVLITIEDVSADGNTAEEVKNKTRDMSRQQMLMMTNGMMEPQIETDKKVTDAGVFEYYLEINQTIPNFMDMKTSAYIAVKDNIAYSFQLIAMPSVFREHKAVFTQMAKDFQFIEYVHKDYTESAYLEHHINQISVKTPPSWRINNNNKEEGVLAEFTSSSQERPDVITIYKGDDAHRPSANTHIKSTSVVGGITIQCYTEGNSQRERRRVVIGNYTIIIVPQKVVMSPFSDNDLVTFAKSITTSSLTTTATTTYFVNLTDKYKCLIRETGSILYSMLGDGSVMYFPAGIEVMREEDGKNSADHPSVTIRCGHPDTDDSCATSLTEWRQRMLREDSSIGHIEDTEVDGAPAITFSTTDMQEMGFGARAEVKTAVYITVRKDGSTCLVRWECDKGAFRRNEKNMLTFIDNLKML